MSPRTVANRAEVYAAQLRRLASDMGAGDVARAQSTVDSDRAETLGAGERLAEALAPGLPDGCSCHARIEVYAIQEGDYAIADLGRWADRWDAFALAVDP